MNILVVDDDVLMIECLKRGLKMKGFKVYEAINANEALGHIEDHENRIDLVVTDFAMPGMNGIELLKMIRIHYPALPVILMTAYGDKKQDIDALCNPLNGFLLKPFTLVDLLREIGKVSVYGALNPHAPLTNYN